MIGKKCYRDINRILNERLEEKKTLIAVHRGVWGGNIIENTVPAIDLALKLGGDMAECDVSISTDDVLYAFHDNHEKRLLKCSENIMTLSSKEIDELMYCNSLSLQSGVRPQRMEEIFETFKNGELINIDRAWRGDLQKTLNVMSRHPHIIHQAVIKTPVEDEYLEILDKHPDKFMYMPIVYSIDELKKVLTYENINVVGAEIIAHTCDHELYTQEAIDWIHSLGLYVWVNAIVLSNKEKHILYGSLNDDKAIENPDENWGALMDRGVDIIQTDWPIILKTYRDDYMAKKKNGGDSSRAEG